MLTRMRIAGFRSCTDLELDEIGKLTALIGRNSAGKSNVLEAINAFARLACSTGPVSRAWLDVPLYPQGISGKLPALLFEATIELAGRKYDYHASATQFFGKGGDPGHEIRFTETLEVRDPRLGDITVFQRFGQQINVSESFTPGTGAPGGLDLGVGPHMATMPFLASLFPHGHPILFITEPLRFFLGGVRYYALDEPAQTPQEWQIGTKSYRLWLGEYRETGNLGPSVPTQILHLSLAYPDLFEELQDRLGQKGLRLIEHIHVVEYKPTKGERDDEPSYTVLFELSQDAGGLPKNVHGFHQLSQGTRRIVRLLTALTFGESSIALVEHPEESIHKGLVRRLASLIAEEASGHQVMLATHSDTLMNLLDPEAIRFVSMEQGATTVRRLTSAEKKAASAYINSDVSGTLSEFLHSVED